MATWVTYFPNAHIYPIDIKTRDEIETRARPYGATETLVKHQSQFGCRYDRGMWANPRIHLTLGVDASDESQLRRVVVLPKQVDLIIDDGSHKLKDQEATLRTLWDRLRPGGFYIIEDLLVGVLPWSAEHADQVPSNNTGCGGECFFPQRPAEHPLLYDRFNLLARKTALDPETAAILRENDWFWALTGVHRGGGVDASLVIRKSGSFETRGSLSSVSMVALLCVGACVSMRICKSRRDEKSYLPLRSVPSFFLIGAVN